MSRDIFGYPHGVMFPASSEQRLGMLLNTVPCTAQAPTRSYPAGNVNGAKGENPALHKNLCCSKKMWIQPFGLPDNS